MKRCQFIFQHTNQNFYGEINAKKLTFSRLHRYGMAPVVAAVPSTDRVHVTPFNCCLLLRFFF